MMARKVKIINSERIFSENGTGSHLMLDIEVSENNQVVNKKLFFTNYEEAVGMEGGEEKFVMVLREDFIEEKPKGDKKKENEKCFEEYQIQW